VGISPGVPCLSGLVHLDGDTADQQLLRQRSGYVQSAAIMFLVIIAVFAIRRRPRHGQTAWPLLGEVVATAAWTAIGLSVAIFFAAATGCSA
jgi:hypothetical protein